MRASRFRRDRCRTGQHHHQPPRSSQGAGSPLDIVERTAEARDNLLRVVDKFPTSTTRRRSPAGLGHNLALKRDGTVVAWGGIFDGQGYVPATVPDGLSGVIAIASGDDHDLALKQDGTVVAWGRNDAGQATVPSGLERFEQPCDSARQLSDTTSPPAPCLWRYLGHRNSSHPNRSERWHHPTPP